MKNILVPVGSSKNAQHHLQYAIDFAKSVGAKVFVVQIYNVYTKAGTLIKIDHILERESKAFLEAHVSKIEKKGVEVITKVLKGKLVDTIELACKRLQIDLIILEPRTNSIKEEVYLGKTSGKIVKRTQIPALIVPEKYTFKPIVKSLIALKTTKFKNKHVFDPLLSIKAKFKTIVNILLVKTSQYKEGDFDFDNNLRSMIVNKTEAESPTTFQAVLEHYKNHSPDLLCVIRRKRGFFSKLWEQDIVLKKDFHSSHIPVLVLSGYK